MGLGTLRMHAREGAARDPQQGLVSLEAHEQALRAYEQALAELKQTHAAELQLLQLAHERELEAAVQARLLELGGVKPQTDAAELPKKRRQTVNPDA